MLAQLPPVEKMPLKLLDRVYEDEIKAMEYFKDKLNDNTKICGCCGEWVLNHAEGCEYVKAVSNAEWDKILDDVETRVVFTDYITFDTEVMQ